MKKEHQRVVMSSIYEGHAVKQAITKLSPDKLILFIDEPSDVRKKEKITQVIKTIKDFFKETITIETIKIPSYDIPKIMREVIKRIDEESKKENKIFIHITESRKTISLALLFAAYRRKSRIGMAYYITEEKHSMIRLPLLSFNINNTKKSLLKEVLKGNGELKDLQEKIKLKQSATYQNIQELKTEGYLEGDKEFKITELGRIMVL